MRRMRDVAASTPGVGRDAARRRPRSTAWPTRVRAEILTGELEADAPLREEAAAAAYGVSRHTVRAAFQRLVAERLAVAMPYRGVRVASFDRETIIALQQFRAALEVEAVRIAGERFGPDWPDVRAGARPRRARPPRGISPTGSRPSACTPSSTTRSSRHPAAVGSSRRTRRSARAAALPAARAPHYTLESLVAEHRTLLAEVQSRGPDALREHLEHSTRLLVGG
jgi:DNA-binding GntR family transcriptional regulator